MFATKKELGQHWLYDLESLQAMADGIDLKKTDTVLEVGPGLGTLTTVLARRAKSVVTVEFDADLARELVGRVPVNNLRIVRQDILKFNLLELPKKYKIAANIPYYLTSNLLRVLCESTNPFSKAALLVQKEVAERVAAEPGDMSMLSVSVQLYCTVRLGAIVPAELFTPAPKVDSQILLLEYRDKPLFADIDHDRFFRVVKAGFSQKRKTLLNALSAGLQLARDETESLLEEADIFPVARAQSLSLEQWHDLYEVLASHGKA
ncbi:MAG TPA: 16S rRNA (adenine(1518)-N(6)/adenine(1519)-N(6))-dimethyltransferase RsmA [Candidatus Saccharimonadales bacterium]|nr:16S rRNA (adenine(1518)-N(6)/adenine(1519)-N(6))-dimethyltransferase RsmA [Candidatus Saccharimonadales bacterium]